MGDGHGSATSGWLCCETKGKRRIPTRLACVGATRTSPLAIAVGQKTEKSGKIRNFLPSRAHQCGTQDVAPSEGKDGLSLTQNRGPSPEMPRPRKCRPEMPEMRVPGNAINQIPRLKLSPIAENVRQAASGVGSVGRAPPARPNRTAKCYGRWQKQAITETGRSAKAKQSADVDPAIDALACTGRAR